MKLSGVLIGLGVIAGGAYLALRQQSQNAPAQQAPAAPAPITTQEEINAVLPEMAHFGLTQPEAIKSFTLLETLRQMYPKYGFSPSESGTINVSGGGLNIGFGRNSTLQEIKQTMGQFL